MANGNRNRYAQLKHKITLPLTIETDCIVLDILIDDVEINHYPERPMPHCQDPSNPAYCDPGDPEEVEFDNPDIVIQEIRNNFYLEVYKLRLKVEEQINAIGEINLSELLPED